MEIDGTQILARTITDEEDAILAAWLALLKSGGSLQTGRIREAELQTQAKLVLGQLRDALASGQADVGTETCRGRCKSRPLNRPEPTGLKRRLSVAASA